MSVEIDNLISKATNELNRLHYYERTVREYQYWWRKLDEFIISQNICEFNDNAIEQYFLHTFNCSYQHPISSISKRAKKCKRCLSVLSQINITGTFYRRNPSKDHTIKECYQPAADEFLTKGCASLSRASKRQMQSHLECFLQYLDDHEITDYNKLTKNDIISFWDTRNTVSKTTRTYDSYFLRKYFDFLYDNGYTVVDNSVFVPNVKGSNKGKIPSYYTTNELTTLLACVDRNNPIGKRDYAILLFAIRYGPRVEDIRNLKLKDIDWDKSTISYIQEKNSKPITFNLYDDVATAFIDYFKNGRPVTECRNVFVRHIAPFDEFGKDDNLHHIISKYMSFAGFTDFHHRKRGLYSMRHSIAGNMLNEGVSIQTVAETLNHAKTETSMNYTKIDTEHTKTCALEVD